MPIDFGDNVRVLDSPETTEKNLANLVGSVYGMTTPSITSVEVVGKLQSDYAVNVHFEELGESFWFAPELLEFIDHGEGQTMSLDGVNKKWTRTADGDWIEESTSRDKRPWWKLW